MAQTWFEFGLKQLRFNLLELLALPLLFVAISFVIPFFKSEGFLYAKRAASMLEEIEELTNLANGKLADRLASVSAKDINGMMTDPNSEFGSLLWRDQRSDLWGNAYVCVENEKSVDQRWQFYSKGIDRVSHTDGSDRDDLSSWDLSCDYYIKSDKSRIRVDTYTVAVLWALPVFVLFVGVLRYCQRGSVSVSADDRE